MSIRIGGIDYKVEIVSPKGEELDYGEYWGTINEAKCKIYISEKLEKDKQNQILIHEILHGIFSYLELSEEIHTEENILKIGRVLHQVLKDNDLKF